MIFNNSSSSLFECHQHLNGNSIRDDFPTALKVIGLCYECANAKKTSTCICDYNIDFAKLIHFFEMFSSLW